MNLTSEEWRTLVAIPAIVTLVMNWLTPLIGKMALAALSRTAAGMHGSANFVFRIRIAQLEREIAEFRKLQTDHSALMSHYLMTIDYMRFGLWALLLSPAIGALLVILSSNYAHFLPGFYADFYSRPGAVFAFAIGTTIAAGPFQAALCASYMRRRLKQLSTDPKGLFKKLEDEKYRMLSALQAGQKPSQ